jgi:ankyrin repeat protein
MAIVLLKRGVAVDADRAVKNGRTALEGAAESGHLDVIKVLFNEYERAGKRSLPGYGKVRELTEKGPFWSAVRTGIGRLRLATNVKFHVSDGC